MVGQRRTKCRGLCASTCPRQASATSGQLSRVAATAANTINLSLSDNRRRCWLATGQIQIGDQRLLGIGHGNSPAGNASERVVVRKRQI